MTTMMTDQQLQQKFKDLCEDGLWTIFETKEIKVPARARLDKYLHPEEALRGDGQSA